MHIQPPASAASVWTVSVQVPDSVQTENSIKCLKNECSLVFRFSSFLSFFLANRSVQGGN